MVSRRYGLLQRVSYVGHQSQVTGFGHGLSYFALEFQAGARDAAGQNAALLVHELEQEVRVLVVHVLDAVLLKAAVLGAVVLLGQRVAVVAVAAVAVVPAVIVVALAVALVAGPLGLAGLAVAVRGAVGGAIVRGAVLAACRAGLLLVRGVVVATATAAASGWSVWTMTRLTSARAIASRNSSAER